MTAYYGGKKRLGKRIYQVISELESELTDEKLPYFEPFCGMCGVLKHFASEEGRKVYASDLNGDIISMWKAVQKGWKPPTACTREKYERLKKSPKASPERGFIGTTCSFSGIFFKGGFRTSTNKYDFCKSGKKGVLEVGKVLNNVKFFDPASFDQFAPKGMLIYCDPPYKGNKLNTELFQAFDHDKFWKVMRKWSKDNIVVISEREAPSDFECIWKQDYRTSHLNQGSGKNVKKKHVECLFMKK